MIKTTLALIIRLVMAVAAALAAGRGASTFKNLIRFWADSAFRTNYRCGKALSPGPVFDILKVYV